MKCHKIVTEMKARCIGDQVRTISAGLSVHVPLQISANAIVSQCEFLVKHIFQALIYCKALSVSRVVYDHMQKQTINENVLEAYLFLCLFLET